MISEPKATHSRRRTSGSTRVWCSPPRRGKVGPRNFLRVIEKAAATAKVEGVGVHTMRHSAATMWLESGIHIKQVADLLGHYSTSITGDIYGHGSDDGARRAIEKLGEQLGL